MPFFSLPIFLPAPLDYVVPLKPGCSSLLLPFHSVVLGGGSSEHPNDNSIDRGDPYGGYASYSVRPPYTDIAQHGAAGK